MGSLRTGAESSGELHSRYGRRTYVVFGVLMVEVGLVAVISALQRDAAAWLVVVGVLFALTGIVLVVRSWRLGITWDADTLTIHNPFRTARLPRTGTTIRCGSRSIGASVPRATSDGATYRIYGLTLPPGQPLQDLMSRLELAGLLAPPSSASIQERTT